MDTENQPMNDAQLANLITMTNAGRGTYQVTIDPEDGTHVFDTSIPGAANRLTLTVDRLKMLDSPIRWNYCRDGIRVFMRIPLTEAAPLNNPESNSPEAARD